MSEQTLMVTASLIKHDNKLLIAQRKNVGRFANKWEFPGGKIDPGETPEECLRRELQEELGIETIIGQLFSDTLYLHELGKIRQFTYWVELRCNPTDINVLEHQAIAWVAIAEIADYAFAGADLAVVEKLMNENNWHVSK